MITPGESMIIGLLLLVIWSQTGRTFAIGFWAGILNLFVGLVSASWATLGKLLN